MVPLNVKEITHSDLDALGCAILSKLVFENVDITYCSYISVNDKVNNFLDSYIKNPEEFDLLLITDITVSDEVAKRINDIMPNKVLLIDHHITEKERLSIYEWVNINEYHQSIRENATEDKSCATSLLFLYLLEKGYLNESYRKELTPLVETIRQFDTWEWTTIFNNIVPKQLNDLFYFIGKHEFLNRFLKDTSINFNEKELFFLENEDKKIKRYSESKAKELIIKEILGYKAGIVYADQYTSELGYILGEKFNNLDFIVLIDFGRGKISYRTSKKDVHVGNIVKELFGAKAGGHPGSAGSEFDQNIISDTIDKIFIK